MTPCNQKEAMAYLGQDRRMTARCIARQIDRLARDHSTQITFGTGDERDLGGSALRLDLIMLMWGALMQMGRSTDTAKNKWSPSGKLSNYPPCFAGRKHSVRTGFSPYASAQQPLGGCRRCQRNLWLYPDPTESKLHWAICHSPGQALAPFRQPIGARGCGSGLAHSSSHVCVIKPGEARRPALHDICSARR